MSNFEVKVRRIENVEDHPAADRLSICTILGYRAITAKVPVDHFSPDNPDGVRYVHRYQPGDLIVYVPEAAVVPHDLLKEYDYWSEEKDKGMLAGKAGDRVKIIRLRGIYSQGLVWPAERRIAVFGGHDVYHIKAGDRSASVTEGEDVAEFFGITKYEPPVPSAMNGDCAGIAEFACNYDFDSIQRWPDFFEPGEPVSVTEKLHGTFTRISYRRNYEDERLFGENKNIAIASKGLGGKGIVFIDTEKNRAGNVYVRAAIENGLIEKIEAIADHYGNDSLDIFGETFGPGIQKFHYGLAKPAFRMFDIRSDFVFDSPADRHWVAINHEIAEVPILYEGPFDINEIERVRDEPTTFAGSKNIREGVVITATGDQAQREHGGERMRPILKAVSPAYLLKEDEDAIQ